MQFKHNSRNPSAIKYTHTAHMLSAPAIALPSLPPGYCLSCNTQDLSQIILRVPVTKPNLFYLCSQIKLHICSSVNYHRCDISISKCSRKYNHQSIVAESTIICIHR